MSVTKRCAVYTRKSTEEGLDQAFNSLHAQREACEAYIKSQAHEGWKLVKTAYDDGGLSGGTLERPALKQLLADIAAGQIQIIVVYKVDRLTRSLADFAKIVDVLDGHGASFVSVTQQFNTTTSMGRLTLNVLLSFAQFEREVAGERIRDKIAASRRKGMWMGGSLPLGYDVTNRELVVNETEAVTVREIFEAYVRLGSVGRLQAELDRRGVVSKKWVSTTGRIWGGVRLARGPLYWMLRNPVYVGRVAHKGQVFEGRQAPIVDLALWEKVQAMLSSRSAGREKRSVISSNRPLAGRLFDDRGNTMSPSYVTKASGKRYAYYVSQALLRGEKEQAGAIPRVRAEEVERLVLQALNAEGQGDAGGPDLLHQRVARVVIHRDRVEIHKADVQEDEDATIVVPVKLAYRNRAKILTGGGGSPDAAMVRAVARAHEWRRWLEEGEANSYRAVAKKAGVDPSYVQLVLPLAFLAPQLTRELLDGRCQVVGGLMELLRRGIPVGWREQMALFKGQSA